MSEKVNKFIQSSISDAIKYIFNSGKTPLIDIVRTQHILYDNRLLELRVIIYRDVRVAGKLIDDSNPETWNLIFNDVLKSFLKSGSDEQSAKTEFFLHGYIMPIEYQITEDPIIFLDKIIVEKKNEKLEKVIQYIKESPAGRTQKDVTLFIKNYKPEDRKDILDKINNSEEIIRNDQKTDGAKKGTTVYIFRSDCNE